jgi:hypothetical protein
MLTPAAFASLSEEEKAAIRAAQKSKKENKAKRQKPAPSVATTEPSALPTVDRCVVTSSEYFDACPGGLFRDPNLPPTEEALELLLSALDAGDEQAESLNTCNYFQFSGPQDALWDPTFNARLAWEGFFTITTGSRRGRIEPLPELQPFYGVLHFEHFEKSKHVRKTLAKMAREPRGYQLSNNLNPERTWRMIDEYHKVHHSSNWLTKRYFEMMRAAHDDPAINFQMHCIELAVAAPGEAAIEVGDDGEATSSSEAAANASGRMPISAGGRVRFAGLIGRPELNGKEATAITFDEAAGRWAVGFGSAEQIRVKPANLIALPPAPEPIAGEIGFSIGGVYTSLSGWTGERSTHSVGTCQLVLLGRWLQRRGYAFWSLGHCYSPEMDYKRQLGHRIYERHQFRTLLKRHRGPFQISASASTAPRAEAGSTAAFLPLASGDIAHESSLIGLTDSATQG